MKDTVMHKSARHPLAIFNLTDQRRQSAILFLFLQVSVFQLNLRITMTNSNSEGLLTFGFVLSRREGFFLFFFVVENH